MNRVGSLAVNSNVSFQPPRKRKTKLAWIEKRKYSVPIFSRKCFVLLYSNENKIGVTINRQRIPLTHTWPEPFTKPILLTTFNSDNQPLIVVFVRLGPRDIVSFVRPKRKWRRGRRGELFNIPLTSELAPVEKVKFAD